MISEYEILTLSNGKRVGNFSSPHSFEFTDGSILPAVSNELAEKYKVTFEEIELDKGDVKLSFELSSEIYQRMNEWVTLHRSNNVDVVFVPLPMLTALKEGHTEPYLLSLPFRAIRIEDRIKKLVSISKQCI